MASNNTFFDFFNDLFCCKDITEKYTNEVFKQNLFPMTRRVAIKYPVEAVKLNRLGIDPKYAAYAFNKMLYNGYGGRKESWIYLTGTKKSKEKKEKNKLITCSLISDYASHYGYKIEDVELALKLFKDEAEADLLEYNTIRKQLNEE